MKSPAAPRQLVLGRGKLCITVPTINDSDLRHFARASRRPIPGPGGVSGDQPLRRSHPNPSSIKQWLTRGKGLSCTEIANSAQMECDGDYSRHPAHELAEVQPVGKLNATILTNRTNLCYANSVTQALLWAHGSWTGGRLWRPAQAASTLAQCSCPGPADQATTVEGMLEALAGGTLRRAARYRHGPCLCSSNRTKEGSRWHAKSRLGSKCQSFWLVFILPHVRLSSSLSHWPEYQSWPLQGVRIHDPSQGL